MKRVLTMTLNPCIDRTIYFQTFKQGGTNYVDNVIEEAPAGNGVAATQEVLERKEAPAGMENADEWIEEKIKEKAEELVKAGISHVCISLGEDGMLLADQKEVKHYAAKPADVKSLQGAGDAMVAGLCKAIYEKEETKMAEYALKMAASTISLPGTCMGSLE